MSPEQTESIRKRLLDLKAELESVAHSAQNAAQPVELDQARVGRLSRMDAMQAQAIVQESNRRRDIQLQRIQAALLRLERGEYGECLKCTGPIEDKRLTSDPAAFLCLPCAAQSDIRP